MFALVNYRASNELEKKVTATQCARKGPIYRSTVQADILLAVSA